MSLNRSRALLELGQRLVAQLRAGDDLLASWMAHYIAEHIEAAENASGEDREPAQGACAKAPAQKREPICFAFVRLYALWYAAPYEVRWLKITSALWSCSIAPTPVGSRCENG